MATRQLGRYDILHARLKDRVAIIAGGACGIGRSTALLFAQQGAKVMIGDIEEKEGIYTLEMLCSSGGLGAFLRTDISTGSECAALVANTIDRFGTVDIVVVVPAWAESGRVTEVSDEGWRKTFSVSVDGARWLCASAIPYMVEKRSGSIVSVSSVQWFSGIPQHCAYISAKAALTAMMKSIAIDYGPYNIRANSVSPGAIDSTPTLRSLSCPEDYQASANRPVLRRHGSPEEVARAILFLASDDSSYVTGHDLVVDGGIAIHHAMKTATGQQ